MPQEVSNDSDGRRDSIVGLVATTVSRLTPEFIGLLAVNAVFVLGMLWFFDRQNAARERLLAPLMEVCAHSVPLEAVKMLAHPEGH